jgi:hypothetical protein
MSKNQTQNSGLMMANLEVDYLREQLKETRKKLKDVSQARELLEKNGYFVKNLWHVDDVMSSYNCSEEVAQDVLYDALTNNYIMENIWEIIQDVATDLNLEEKQIE